jgi:tetratricopeptide (TPR) repeat protein
MYLALLGPALIVAWGLSRLNPSNLRPATWITGALLLVLAALSFHQLSYWQTEEATLRRTLAINPNSDLALNNLGQVYAKKGDLAEAERLFKAAVVSNPDFIAAHVNLVVLYKSTGRPDEAIHAFYELKRANDLLPPETRADFSDDIFFKAGQGAARSGHFADAARYFEEAARVAPQDPRPKEALRQAREILRSASRPSPSPR